MSVVPGKGGQKFMPIALDKLAYLAKEKKEHNYSYLIEVDGGINNETCEEAKNAGAEVLVAGSYILKSENYKERVDILKR
jgi:ribulose-phosphate 3-epimerase